MRLKSYQLSYPDISLYTNCHHEFEIWNFYSVIFVVTQIRVSCVVNQGVHIDSSVTTITLCLSDCRAALATVEGKGSSALAIKGTALDPL